MRYAVLQCIVSWHGVPCLAPLATWIPEVKYGVQKIHAGTNYPPSADDSLNSFSSMRKVEFRLGLHWSLSFRVGRQAITSTNNGPFHWRMYELFSLNVIERREVTYHCFNIEPCVVLWLTEQDPITCYPCGSCVVISINNIKTGNDVWTRDYGYSLQ